MPITDPRADPADASADPHALPSEPDGTCHLGVGDRPAEEIDTGLAQKLLAAAMIVGALSGCAYGLVRLTTEEQPFKAGLLPTLEAATPYAALVIALVVTIDQMLMATARVARPGVERAQADAYAMLRSVAPSALAAASAGYLTVAVGAGQSWIILSLVLALAVLGVAIAALAARLTATTSTKHLTPTHLALVVGIMIPLAVTALGVTVAN